VSYNNLKNTEIYTRVNQQDIRRIKSSLVFESTNEVSQLFLCEIAIWGDNFAYK